jgi:hypothetical protein
MTSSCLALSMLTIGEPPSTVIDCSMPPTVICRLIDAVKLPSSTIPGRLTVAKLWSANDSS